ncbi:MAG: sigma-70 family RNA polymerase sigma factor, partial [Lachnospiraceae bacterium]|nr:sigma-70 family RNA polymerase sigma factor [Lachnospiraceae bacterium]
MKNTKNLVKEVLDGNTNAFEELYQLTSKQVYFTCLSFVKNEQDALDLMQETYLSALTHLSALKEPERFAQWVSSIATNKCRNYLSKKSPLLLDEEVLDTLPANEDELTLPEHYITDREKRKILMDIMSEQLSMVQYQTILLYYFDGLSQQEIAKCMECPEGTVSYRLSVARNKIKEGVLSYEKKSGDKLYCVAGVPFLAAFFLAQAEEIIVPDVLSNILGAFTSTGVSAAEGVAQTAAENASQAVAKVTAEAAKQTAKKAGATAFTKSAVFKIGLGIAAITLVGAMVATVILIATISSKNSAASETIVTEADSNTNPDSASGST